MRKLIGALILSGALGGCGKGKEEVIKRIDPPPKPKIELKCAGTETEQITDLIHRAMELETALLLDSMEKRENRSRHDDPTNLFFDIDRQRCKTARATLDVAKRFFDMSVKKPNVVVEREGMKIEMQCVNIDDELKFRIVLTTMDWDIQQLCAENETSDCKRRGVTVGKIISDMALDLADHATLIPDRCEKNLPVYQMVRAQLQRWMRCITVKNWEEIADRLEIVEMVLVGEGCLKKEDVLQKPAPVQPSTMPAKTD